MAIDCVYRVDQPHIRGQLAAMCGAIAEEEGLIGDIVTIRIGRERSIREISVEVRDYDQAKRVASAIEMLKDVKVLGYWDRAIHAHEGGKLAVRSIARLESVQDMRDIYTPGVARVCTAIAEQPSLANRFTMVGRTVAICTNGTRVLGLGNIGPLASMPVMEGKAMFYASMVDISAVPVLIDSEDPDEFVETVLRIAPGFGAIHLEDIRAPDCFEIERRLIAALEKPVMHDDVHGTAVAAFAAVLAACEQAGIELGASTVGQLGLGAAGLGIATLMVQGGARRVIASDPQEASHALARERGIESAGFEEVMSTADVVVATTGQPGLIKPELIRKGQVILALTNPEPEISPRAAEAAGAAFAADGTSVNNVLGFPGIFRGALACGAVEISLGMKLAAARAIADQIEAADLVADPLDPAVHAAVAAAVQEAAENEGLAHPERVPAGL
jgi:malate dehydrogenase (oxaloacetate-decarboxylating)